MPDWLRLAAGTLTRFPVPAPHQVDRTTARWAMVSAPVIAIPLALVCGLPLLIETSNTASGLLISALTIALLAFATRAIHWDGLADTADALGSGRPAAQALEIARKSDIGPFGALTMAVNLLLQVLALGACVAAGAGYLALIGAVITSRIALVWACTRGVHAARTDGLGALVAGTVPRLVTIGWTIAIILAAYLLNGGFGVLAVLAGLAAAVVVLAISRRRLGGVTGDVLGAVIEISATVTLVVTALS